MATESTNGNRSRVKVSPETAATLREENEILGAALTSANAVAQAALAAAQATIANAKDRYRTALKPIVRQYEIDGEIVDLEGFGENTFAVVQKHVTPKE